MTQRILKNRAYTGMAYRGDNVNPNGHQPIVSVAEWQAAQLAPVRSEARGKLPNILGGCPVCSMPLPYGAQNRRLELWWGMAELPLQHTAYSWALS
jgi:hypothetical protein